MPHCVTVCCFLHIQTSPRIVIWQKPRRHPHGREQLCHKVAICYNAMPRIYPPNCPFPSMFTTLIQYTHPSTNPTHYPRWHPDLLSRFATLHFLDRQTDWQNGLGDIPIRIFAYSPWLHSDAANTYVHVHRECQACVAISLVDGSDCNCCRLFGHEQCETQIFYSLTYELWKLEL